MAASKRGIAFAFPVGLDDAGAVSTDVSGVDVDRLTRHCITNARPQDDRKQDGHGGLSEKLARKGD